MIDCRMFGFPAQHTDVITTRTSCVNDLSLHDCATSCGVFIVPELFKVGGSP